MESANAQGKVLKGFRRKRHTALWGFGQGSEGEIGETRGVTTEQISAGGRQEKHREF